MNESKHESLIVIGFALIIIGVIIIFFGVSQPKVSVVGTPVTTVLYSEEAGSVAQNTESQSASQQHFGFPINLNTCTYDELLVVDGIGEKRAAAIIQYREVIGVYTSVEQIMDIQGIGTDTYAQIAQYLCV